MHSHLFRAFVITGLTAAACVWAQQAAQPKPEDAEVWQPVPQVVTPGSAYGEPPSMRLFFSTARIWTSGSPRRTRHCPMDGSRRPAHREQVAGARKHGCD